MALHMILIGIFSLITQSEMYELLQHPFWRILTIGIVLTVNSVVAEMIPRWNIVLEVLRTQSESAEARPFMIFLWFCNAFLLLDSLLCVAKIAWGLLPLFLIGSTVLLELKQVHDRDGHHAGDLYLMRFVQEFGSLLRRDDIFSRVGGDEFAVLLPGCEKDAAANRMDDIRRYMTEKSDSCISFSYGIAHVSGNTGDSPEQIFRRADQEMYLDKQARRR